jgi:uncharacterized protein (DUF2147 family)
MAAFLPGLTAVAAQPPLGLWSTPNRDGVVQIGHCGGPELCGVIVGVTVAPGSAPPRDVAGVPQCHLVLLSRLKPDEDGRWRGQVRNPEDGHVYSAEVWVGPDGNMRLRGFVGLDVFGVTQTWRKFLGSVQPDCRFSPART